jgi:hypothetical protein
MPALDPEYVAARSVLLDALDALADHRDALVVVGAQAVYLRTEPIESYQDFTTDADLALDSGLLSDRPGLEEAMRPVRRGKANRERWRFPRHDRADPPTAQGVGSS